MKMKREGAVGLILIAILVVVMLVFLRGKSLEDIMGSGYTQADDRLCSRGPGLFRPHLPAPGAVLLPHLYQR